MHSECIIGGNYQNLYNLISKTQSPANHNIVSFLYFKHDYIKAITCFPAIMTSASAIALLHIINTSHRQVRLIQINFIVFFQLHTYSAQSPLSFHYHSRKLSLSLFVMSRTLKMVKTSKEELLIVKMIGRLEKYFSTASATWQSCPLYNIGILLASQLSNILEKQESSFVLWYRNCCTHRV